jgi:hypothetical protein
MVVCVIAMIVMMMMVVVLVMVVIVSGTVGAALRLKSCLYFAEFGSETLQHFFNYVVGPDTEGVFANLCREMAISKMPGESHQLMAVFVPDFHQ